MQKIVVILLLPILLFAVPKTDSLNSQLKIYQQTRDYKNEVATIYALNAIYRNQGDYLKCDSLIKAGLSVCLKNNYKTKYADLYRLVGINENLRGNLDSSIAAFQKSLDLHQTLKDIEGVSNQYENMGISYKDAGKYKEALECQLKALGIREKNGFKKRISANFKNIAILYNFIKNPAKHEEYTRKSLAFLQANSASQLSDYACVYNEMGQVFRNKNMLDSSLYYYTKTLDESKKINWLTGISTALNNIGDIYMNLGDYEKALDIHLESLVIVEKTQNAYNLCSNYIHISEIYGKLKKPDFNKAVEYGKKAYQLAKQHKYVNDEAGAAEILGISYAKSGEYRKAYEMQLVFKALKDSILSVDLKKNLEELESKYQNEAKTRKIELLDAENKLNQIKIRWGIVFIILIIVLVMLFINYQHKKNLMAKNDLEQKLLRSQMNPHFIFNALAAIQNFMLKNDSKKAAGYLGSFSSLSRSVLTNSAKETVSLAEEIKMLKDYIELEKLRMQDSFDYEIIFDHDEDLEFIKIPPMMIQPFIENAIRHGLSSVKIGGHLKLSITCHENHIVAEVLDNGIGISSSVKNKNSNHKSMAMSIFEKRKNLLQNKYKKNFSFAINDLLAGSQNETGTRITVTLPIIN